MIYLIELLGQHFAAFAHEMLCCRRRCLCLPHRRTRCRATTSRWLRTDAKCTNITVTHLTSLLIPDRLDLRPASEELHLSIRSHDIHVTKTVCFRFILG